MLHLEPLSRAAQSRLAGRNANLVPDCIVSPLDLALVQVLDSNQRVLGEQAKLQSMTRQGEHRLKQNPSDLPFGVIPLLKISMRVGHACRATKSCRFRAELRSNFALSLVKVTAEWNWWGFMLVF